MRVSMSARPLSGVNRNTAAIAPEEAYLKRLLADVRVAVRAGIPISKAVETVECDSAERWQLVDQFHKRNVTAAYAEVEWEQ